MSETICNRGFYSGPVNCFGGNFKFLLFYKIAFASGIHQICNHPQMNQKSIKTNAYGAKYDFHVYGNVTSVAL